MSDQKNILHDDSNGLDYVVVGDYYLPMGLRDGLKLREAIQTILDTLME